MGEIKNTFLEIRLTVGSVEEIRNLGLGLLREGNWEFLSLEYVSILARIGICVFIEMHLE